MGNLGCIGVDSVYKAPSGAIVALGMIPFATGNVGANTPAVAIVRGNPFVPGDPGTGFDRIFTVHNAATTAALVKHGDTKPDDWNASGKHSDQYQAMLSLGSVLYFFVGSVPGALPPGWWAYNPKQIFESASNPGFINPGVTFAGFGSASGTLATDPGDFAWAQGQAAAWMVGKSTLKCVDPRTLIGSQSTLSQVAPVAALPSSSQLFLYAAVAAGMAFLYYELS
jgi:hypothetical protein